jgi:hypothetical protein
MGPLPTDDALRQIGRRVLDEMAYVESGYRMVAAYVRAAREAGSREDIDRGLPQLQAMEKRRAFLRRLIEGSQKP